MIEGVLTFGTVLSYLCTRYVDRKDNGEAADTRRVGEVRCVVLVERHCA